MFVGHVGDAVAGGVLKPEADGSFQQFALPGLNTHLLIAIGGALAGLCGGALEAYRATGRYDVKSPNCNIYKALFPEALRLEGLRLLKYQDDPDVVKKIVI